MKVLIPELIVNTPVTLTADYHQVYHTPWTRKTWQSGYITCSHPEEHGCFLSYLGQQGVVKHFSLLWSKSVLQKQYKYFFTLFHPWKKKNSYLKKNVTCPSGFQQKNCTKMHRIVICWCYCYCIQVVKRNSVDFHFHSGLTHLWMTFAWLWLVMHAAFQATPEALLERCQNWHFGPDWNNKDSQQLTHGRTMG